MKRFHQFLDVQEPEWIDWIHVELQDVVGYIEYVAEAIERLEKQVRWLAENKSGAMPTQPEEKELFD